MERARNLLPVSPEHWLRRFEDDAELLAVAAAYEDLKDNPAWLHLSSRLFRLKDTFERAILQGERAPDGRDITPELRSAYGVIMQIIAIPADAVERHRRYEEEVLAYRETVNETVQP